MSFDSTFDSILQRFTKHPNHPAFQYFTQSAKIKFIKGALNINERRTFLNIVLKKFSKMFLINITDKDIFNCNELSNLESHRLKELCMKYPIDEDIDSTSIQFSETTSEDSISKNSLNKQIEISSSQLINDLFVLIYQFLLSDIRAYIPLIITYNIPKVFLFLFYKYQLKDCEFRYIILTIDLLIKADLIDRSLIINNEHINLFFNYNFNKEGEDINLGVKIISYVLNSHVFNCNNCNNQLIKILKKSKCCSNNTILFKLNEFIKVNSINNKYLKELIINIKLNEEDSNLKTFDNSIEVNNLKNEIINLNIIINDLKGKQIKENISNNNIKTSLPSIPIKTGPLPPIPGKGLPPIPGKGLPPIPGKGLPPIPGKGLPPIPGKGLPTIPGKGLPTIPGKGLPTIPGKGLPPIPGKGLPTIKTTPKIIKYIEIPLIKQKQGGKLFDELPIIELNELELNSLEKQIKPKENKKVEKVEIEKFLMNPKKINAIEICLRSGELISNEELKNRIYYQEEIEENRIKVLLDCWPSKPESYDLLDFQEFQKKKNTNSNNDTIELFKGVKKLTRCEELYLLFMLDDETNKYSLNNLEESKKQLSLTYFLIRFETLNPVILKSIKIIKVNCEIIRKSTSLIQFLSFLLSIYNSTVPINKKIQSLDFKNITNIFNKQCLPVMNIINNKMNLNDLFEDLNQLNINGVMNSVNSIWSEILIMYSELKVNIKEVQTIKEEMEDIRKRIKDLEDWLGCEMDKDFLKILINLKCQIRIFLDSSIISK